MSASRYDRLMDRAADGDHEAARKLLEGEWWPGKPWAAADRERVISEAQRARQERQRREAGYPPGARGYVCPACNAQIGQPCTEPTDTGRKAMRGGVYHHRREDLAARG